MTNKSNSETNKYQIADELRPVSRARRAQHNDRMYGEHHVIHGHVPMPPFAPHGLQRLQMERPTVAISNSGHSFDHEGHQPKDHFRAANPAPGGNNSFRLPDINTMCCVGKRAHKGQRVTDNVGSGTRINDGCFQLPNLMGRAPAPPEIPRARHIAHNHNAQLKTAHPGRRLKSVSAADHTAMIGLKPVPPPPKPVDYAPNHNTRKPSPETKVFALRENIMLSPTALKAVSPQSVSDKGSLHEQIRSPSSLIDITDTASDHQVQGPKRGQPSLIDVNVPPTAKGNEAIKGVAGRRKKRPRRF